MDVIRTYSFYYISISFAKRKGFQPQQKRQRLLKNSCPYNDPFIIFLHYLLRIKAKVGRVWAEVTVEKRSGKVFINIIDNNLSVHDFHAE